MTISTTFHGLPSSAINRALTSNLGQTNTIDEYKNFIPTDKKDREKIAGECEKMFFRQFVHSIIPQEDSFINKGIWGGLHRNLFIQALSSTDLSSCLGLKNTILNHLDTFDHTAIGE